MLLISTEGLRNRVEELHIGNRSTLLESLRNFASYSKIRHCKGTIKSVWKGMSPQARGTEIEATQFSCFLEWSPKVKTDAHKQEISCCNCLHIDKGITFLGQDNIA